MILADPQRLTHPPGPFNAPDDDPNEGDFSQRPTTRRQFDIKDRTQEDSLVLRCAPDAIRTLSLAIVLDYPFERTPMMS